MQFETVKTVYMEKQSRRILINSGYELSRILKKDLILTLAQKMNAQQEEQKCPYLSSYLVKLCIVLIT
jgi:hypothetical protein